METLAVLVVLAGSCLLPAILGVPLWRRRVGQNPFYGFRTPLTLSNEQVWFEANALLGRGTTLGGVLGFVATLAIAGVVDVNGPTAWLVLVPVAVLLLGVAQGVWATSAWLGAQEAEVDQEAADAEASAVTGHSTTKAGSRQASRASTRAPENG